MFESGMVESFQSSVDIEDVSYPTFLAVMKYLYEGTFVEDEELCVELLMVGTYNIYIVTLHRYIM